VRAVIVAGEPGGSIPSTRQRIESVWGARVFDHYGMTEVGPVAVEMVETPRSMALLSEHYIAESIEPNGDKPVAEGEIGELVLTNLGRAGSPLIRYRTGDLVRFRISDFGFRITEQPSAQAKQSEIRNLKSEILLDGGILGRTDDMIHLRGNNLYPAAVEAVVRRFPEVVEFRIVVDQRGSLPDLRLEIEPNPMSNGLTLAEAVGRAVRDELLFRIEVIAVAPGNLPRFEMKARRVHKIN
jgi:phenylacetate-CoA ligase